VRVLVADDAVLFRRLLSEVLALIPGVEVVGSASNGKIAIQKVRELKPDLLTLDIEMPEMDGLAVLDALFENGQPKVAVIVVSALSRRGGDLTVRALQKGAFDFITKPESDTPELGRQALLRALEPRIRALSHRQDIRDILRGGLSRSKAESPAPAAADRVSLESNLGGIASRMQRLSDHTKPEMILIGVSTGGPAALAQLLPAIPGDIGVPILVVQHMPPIFTKSLADSLAPKCAVKVREAISGEVPKPGTVYIAPGGQQMRNLRRRPRVFVNRQIAEVDGHPGADG